MNFLDKIRIPNTKVPFSKALLHAVQIAGIGIWLGVVSKLLDIYTSNLGNIFSQMSVWIFICTVISVWSSTPCRAAVNVFSFCIGMLTAYYITAEVTASVYSIRFLYGWAGLAFVSPSLGFCVWYTKGRRRLSKIIVAGIISVMLTIAVILFDKIRVADIIFALLTAFVLRKK